MISSYTQIFGSFLLSTHINLQSTVIENAILLKKVELDLKKKMETSRIAYEFLIMQNAAFKFILELKFDRLINVTIHKKIISPY